MVKRRREWFPFPFHLLDDPFFPVLSWSGGKRWMAFAELAEMDGDYAVAFDWPRPDFNVAAYEFAIGVMALAFPLLEKGDWPPLWRKPPARAEVEAALSPLRRAFFLTGEGPRFLQQFDGIDGDEKPIEALLIDTPGENGKKKNADLLTHRRRYEALGYPRRQWRSMPCNNSRHPAA